MPRKNGRMTPQETVFAKEYAATGDKVYAASKAGYAVPAVSAHKALSRPEVNSEIARIQSERLFQEALPLAVSCLVGLLRNEKAPAGARVQAAKVVFDRTLGTQDGAGGKEPHEMTGEELARAIADLERIAADRAKPVNAAPDPGGIFD